LLTTIALLLLSGALIAQQGLGGAAAPLPPTLLECPDVTAALRSVVDQDTRLRDWANLAAHEVDALSHRVF